jgi:hypothetical protein
MHQEKSANAGPKPFLSKLIHNFYHGKNSQNISATVVLFKKLPKGNNCPIGENSPNLVTLGITRRFTEAANAAGKNETGDRFQYRP